MTYSKATAFTAEEQQLATLAKALSHPARIAIIKLLAQQKTCISGDIAQDLPLSRTTVSQHLQELKAIGLIKGEIDGLKVCYCLNPEMMKQGKTQFDALFTLALKSCDCC
ncbi:ArsR/SmtB family transcription factor [Adhaeribacter rhizoryzae]|uniref:Winged helix-turn-helix transcriptional regulator n=1 Tax=Adhaeribacter rhizoryzae TaxID=2607907 RepID=A0A5M6DBM2_9BACT|nr:metalloregulator ArsR/SmtB family transcription factor [Adhaeribacter rhizoryzae]KAA5544941.1 winged helix-turn-helix transcriptional regulator [Adhaeribacter rhizoryzae]